MSWSTVKLGDVCDVRDGTHDSPKYIESGYPLITSKNLVAGFIDKSNVSYISEEDYKNICKRSKVDFGDILMPMIGTIGNPVIVNEKQPDFAIKNVALIKFNKESPDRSFIKLVLNGQLFHSYIQRSSKGGTQKFLSLGDIRKFPFPLPPLAEQKRIAAILDKADAIKRKREQAIAKLDSLAQSIFVEMFGDLANNSKGWDIGKIGDLLESATYGTSEKANSIGSYAVLRMNNITRSGAIDLKDLKYMYLEENHLDRFLVKAGDVLFNRTNSADLVGKTAIYRMNTPVAYAGYLIRLRVNEMANGEYIAGFLNTKYAKKELRLMCKSIIGMANINAKEIQAMRIPITPIALQEQFATRISKLEKLKASNIAALAKHNQLFASLQNQAFTGQL